MNDERYEQFEDEVAGLKLSAGAPNEIWFARIGIVAALAGPILGIVAYAGSVGTDNPREQTDMVILGLLGISLTVLGVGLFLRYSVVRFFRFWAARIVYELKANAPASPASNGTQRSTVSTTE